MPRQAVPHLPMAVALRKESVDRNAPCCHRITPAAIVALRKESVDRNILGVSIVSKQPVALRKESVDRNAHPGRVGAALCRRSPQGERG